MNKFRGSGWVVALILIGVLLGLGVAENRYPGRAGYQLTGAATGVFEPTQHDTNQLTYVARGIVCEAAGDVKYTCVDGTTCTTTVVAGQTIIAQVVLIFDTGTTLTDAQMTCYK